MKHKLQADVTRGELTADSADSSGDMPEFEVTDLRYGAWSCTCGRECMGDREAVEHLEEVGQA